MPIEIRRIDYTEIELRQALSLYVSRKEGGSDSESRVGTIKVMGGDHFSVAAKVSTPRGNDVVRRVFDHQDIMTAMVLFSKMNSIRLPRHGRKEMSPNSKGGVSMTVRYKLALKPAPVDKAMTPPPASPSSEAASASP